MTKHFTIKELPDSERPYEKFRKYGPSALSDAELLAVIIRSGTSGRKSVDIAQEFLNTGNRNLLNLYGISREDMCRIRGIGPVKAIQLKCVAELSRRIAEARYADGVCMTDAGSVAGYYMEQMRHEHRENLMLAMFDSGCRLLGDLLLSVGSVNTALVEPREVFLTALQCRAVHIILLHNHPSGAPVPSGEDDRATERVALCGRLTGSPLADHIIIGDNSYYSYREHGKLSQNHGEKSRKGENNDE